MASLTWLYAQSDGNTAAQTKTAAGLSFLAGDRALVLGYAMPNGHGDVYSMGVTDSAATNNPTWSTLVTGTTNTTSSSSFCTKLVAFVSDALTADETFDITLDPQGGSANDYFISLGVARLVGVGAVVQVAQDISTGFTDSGVVCTPAGAATAGNLVVMVVAGREGGSLAYDTPPANFATVSGAACGPTGNFHFNAIASTTTAASSFAWGFTSVGGDYNTCSFSAEFVDAASPTVEQRSFRWFNDDGAETATTGAAAQDADLTAPVTDPKLLRVLLQTVNDKSATAWKLQHQIDGSGGYADTPVGSGVAEAWGTVTFGAIGTGANGSTTVAPSYPTGITAGQYLVCVVTSGATSSETPTTPSGWTLLGTGASTDGTYGVDTGPRRATAFGKVADGTESGTLTVSITNGGTCRGTISRFTKAGSGAWVVDGYGANDSTSGTGVSMTFASVDWYDGDAVLVATGQRVDSATQSAQSLTATGITFGTRTNRAATAVTTGNDHRHTVDTFAAVSNASPTENAAPTWAYTASAAASAGGVLVRLREYTAPVTNPVYIAPSTNITTGGEATTQRLSGGTGTFTAGRRWDDENGTDTIDPAADGNTELEFSVALQSLADAQFVDFRLSPVDTFAVTPRWTVGAGGPVSGTAVLAYGGTVAVTGQVARPGSAAAGYGGAVAVTGTAQRLGSAALGYGGAVTATGTIPTVPVAGTAVAAYGGTVTASGAAVRLGTGALAYGGTVTAAGLPVEGGAAVAVYGGAVAVAGQVQRLGSAALGYGGAVAVSGQVARPGTAATTYGGALTATGQTTRFGSAVLGYGGAVAVTAAPAELGTASAVYGGTVVAAGQAQRLGTVVASYGGAVAATGTTPGGPVIGSAALGYGGAVAVAGEVRRSGSAALGYGGTVTATGQAQRLGSAALGYGGTVTATGTTPAGPILGTAALGYGGAVTASGAAVRLGAAALGYGGAVVVAGQAQRLGSAVLVYGAAVDAAGTTVRLGVVVAGYGGTVVVVPAGIDPSRPPVLGRATFGRLARPRLGVVTVRPGRPGRIGF